MSDLLKQVRLDVANMLTEVDRIAGTYAEDPDGYFARRRFETEKVGRRLKEEWGARINDRWDGATVSIAGVRSSSTMGLNAALKNWLKAVDNRLAAEVRS